MVRVLLITLAAALPAWGQELSKEVLLPQHEKTEARMPAAACGKDVYLIVWQTDRNENADIVGVRLDKTGKPIDSKPFVICAEKDAQERPKVTFGDGLFLVVWHDLRNEKDWDVYGARVSPEGTVLDPKGIAVTKTANNQCEADVAWDGKAFQVLWRSFQGDTNASPEVGKLPTAGYHVHGGRVSTSGQLMDAGGVSMAEPSGGSRSSRSLGMAAAVGLPNGELVAGARLGGELCLWRIKEGKPVTEPKLATKRSGFDDVAFTTNGKTVLAVWTTFRDGGGRSSGVSGSGMLVLGADGEAGSAVPVSLSTTMLGQNRTHVRHPSPAWDGKRYVVAWDVPMRPRGKDTFLYEAVYLRSFGEDGTPQGNDAAVVDDPESPAWRPAVASDGAGLTVIAYEKHPKATDNPIRIGIRTLR